jgi:hypothetical protein
MSATCILLSLLRCCLRNPKVYRAAAAVPADVHVWCTAFGVRHLGMLLQYSGSYQGRLEVTYGCELDHHHHPVTN